MPMTGLSTGTAAGGAEPIADVRDNVGESPLWSVDEQALWWVDIEGRQLRRWSADSARVQSWTTPERTGCIVRHPDGGFVGAMETGLFHLRPGADGSLGCERLAAVRHARGDMRFNDGRTDRAGRLWVGTMVRDMSLAAPAGALYRVDAVDGASTALRSVFDHGLITPNGLGFSPDGRTMYLSDSHPSVQRIWAFDLDADGTPRNRREFVDMNRHPGRPDGAAIDIDGGYWICANDAGLVLRFTPDGRLDRSLAVPVAKPAMCCFGGSDLATLFVTSIRPAAPPPAERALAGAVFALRPGTSGLTDPPVARVAR